MKVLVVGGTSSLGLALTARLRTSCEVVTAGRHGCDIEIDLTWPLERMALPAGIDAIVHTAAHFGGNAPSDLVEAEQVNMLGTLKLCLAAAGAKVRHFVYVSSVFAALEEGSVHCTAYALSKRHGEDAARFACAASALPLAIVRPSQIYGGARAPAHQPFLYAMIDRARKGEDIVLYGTRDPLRNFIHVDDVARAIARVVALGVVGTYACQHPQDVTYSQIADAAFRVFGAGGRVRFLRDKPDIPDNVLARDEALYEAIGFHPATTIEDGIRRVAAES